MEATRATSKRTGHVTGRMDSAIFAAAERLGQLLRAEQTPAVEASRGTGFQSPSVDGLPVRLANLAPTERVARQADSLMEIGESAPITPGAEGRVA